LELNAEVKKLAYGYTHTAVSNVCNQAVGYTSSLFAQSHGFSLMAFVHSSTGV
jgi:hypothetical protein